MTLRNIFATKGLGTTALIGHYYFGVLVLCKSNIFPQLFREIRNICKTMEFQVVASNQHDTELEYQTIQKVKHKKIAKVLDKDIKDDKRIGKSAKKHTDTSLSSKILK